MLLYILTHFGSVNRCLVHALPPGSTHELGLENGMGGLRRKEAQSKATSSTVRSP